MISAIVGAALGAALVGAVLAVLRGPLLVVLTELCAASDAAHFWWRIVAVEMVGGTALCASLALVLTPRADGWRWGAVVVQASAAGVLVSLAVVMVAVMAFARSRGVGAGRLG